MSARQRLSVAIVACNEAENLRRTLDSISSASGLTVDEIVLLDSGSTDCTLDIAREHNAIIFEEPWRGYGPGVNSALDHCTELPGIETWILNLDADESLTPALAAEIECLLASPPAYNGYTIPRLNLIFGRWMRHGGLYPDRKLRLFRKGFARLEEDTEPHATPKPTGPTGQLRNHMLHYQYPTLALYKEHMRRYARASVPLMLRRRKVRSSLIACFTNSILNPIFTFLYNYIFRLGFLDGREGFKFHLHHAIYVRWKYQAAHVALKSQQIELRHPEQS